MASDAGIALQAVTLALLLHQPPHGFTGQPGLCRDGTLSDRRSRRRPSGLGGTLGVGNLPIRWLHSQQAAQIRWADLGLVIMGCALWAVVAKWVLERSGSALPKVAMKRLGLG